MLPALSTAPSTASASWPLSVDGRLPKEAEPAARPPAGRPPRGLGRRFVSPAPSAAVSPGTKPPVPPGPAGSGTASVAPAAMPADATLDLASAVGEPPNRADAPDNGATFGTRLTAATACGVGANGGASASLSLSATASAGRADVAACAGALAEASRRSLGCRVGRTCGCVGALAACVGAVVIVSASTVGVAPASSAVCRRERFVTRGAEMGRDGSRRGVGVVPGPIVRGGAVSSMATSLGTPALADLVTRSPAPARGGLPFDAAGRGDLAAGSAIGLAASRSAFAS